MPACTAISQSSPDQIRTTTFQRLPVRFNMVGQVVSRPIAEVDPDISEGLAKRLVRYATSRLEDFGFSHAVEGWPIEVYTMDADLPPSERYYSVRWNNDKNSGLEICGILTRNGWPFIDHGISIAE